MRRQYNRSYGTRKPNVVEMDTLARSMNPALSEYMTGTSVFAPNGTLSRFDATQFLKQVEVPVLFTVGEFDLVVRSFLREVNARR